MDEVYHLRPILTDRGPMTPQAAFGTNGVTRGEQWTTSPTFLCGESGGTYVANVKHVTCKECLALIHA